MLLSNSAFLTQDPDRVYGFLLDLDAVAPCIPGASLGPAGADGSREATVLVRLGPMRFTYSGAVTILESDPRARRAVLQVDAREASGAGTAAPRSRSACSRPATRRALASTSTTT